MHDVFVNEAIDYAITMYLKSKDRPYSPLYNSFLVVVVRMLIEIYGELDIINPYKTKDLMGNRTFYNNLLKYGFARERLDEFKVHMLNYYEWSKDKKDSLINSKSEDFILIQRDLIDMMNHKLMKLQETDTEPTDFINLLYTRDNPNANFVTFNFLVAKNPDFIKNYWIEERNNSKNYVYKERERTVLDPKVYNLLGYQFEEVKDMPTDMLNSINNQAFSYFQIDALDEDRNSKLENALIALSQKKPETVTSGNGFVDGLLLLSMIVTQAAIAFIVVIFLMK